jgi:nucleoside-diphosphate-sugar epimerase
MTLSDTKDRRALITGIAGFTGRYMAARLRADGYRIHGTMQGAADLTAGDSPADEIHAVDLREPHAVADTIAQIRPDVVVHLAGIANVAHDDIANLWLVNVVGTRNLLAALTKLETRPRAVLLASSANVYGNATAGIIDEDVLPQPANDYAASKLAMEFAARTFSEQLPLIFARPFNYTGVGQSTDFLLPKIVDHYARRAKTISLGNTNVSRDFSDVRFVVDAYARLLEAAPNGETFNVCSGVGHTLGDVLDTLARIAGYTIDVVVDPRFVRANEVRTLTGSNAKLRGAIGELNPVALEETLRWMYEQASERYAALPLTA